MKINVTYLGDNISFAIKAKWQSDDNREWPDWSRPLQIRTNAVRCVRPQTRCCITCEWTSGARTKVSSDTVIIGAIVTDLRSSLSLSLPYRCIYPLRMSIYGPQCRCRW